MSDRPIDTRPRIFRRLAIPTALLALACASCATAPAESAVARTLREQRRMETSLPLAEREARIERGLFSDFYEESLGLVASYRRADANEGGGGKGPVHLEQNAHLLAGLAFQFAATGNAEAETRARWLVAGIDALDALNGLDGFPPLEARVAAGRVEVKSERFVASSYMQLLQAQALAWRLFADPALKAAIRAQALRMLEHLRANGLVVVDGRGVPLPYSDISLSRAPIGGSNQLETMVFVYAGCLFSAGDPELEAKWGELRRRMESDYGYARLPFILHVWLPLLEAPTISSSWLNLMKLSALVELTDAPKYRGLLGALARDYRAQENPYFIGLELLHGPPLPAAERARLLRVARERLATYPLTNTSLALGNLGRGVYPMALPPRWIKNGWAYQARRPVPFYDLTSDRYLWKRDLLLLRGNAGDETGARRYSGVDFFEAYWLLAYAEQAAPVLAAGGRPGMVVGARRHPARAGFTRH